jgi:hypothetical protein
MWYCIYWNIIFDMQAGEHNLYENTNVKYESILFNLAINKYTCCQFVIQHVLQYANI